MDRCVVCGIGRDRCNTLRRRALDDETTLSVIRQWLAPKPVEEASRICQNCWVAADRAAIHMSGPSSSSQGSFNKSDISGNTNQLGLVTTAVPKLQIQPPSKEPQLAAANTKLSVSDIEVQTALATGVSETTLQQILKEEEERNAVKRREPPQKRRATRKRRRRSDSSSKEDSSYDDKVDDIEQPRHADDEELENSEIILPVEMKSEPSDGEISMNEEPEIFIPPVKMEPSDGDTDKEQTDPLSLEVKTEPHPSSPAPMYVECATGTPPPSPLPPPRPAPRHYCRHLEDADVCHLRHYGSDIGSDESDDEEEELGYPGVLPRVLVSVMETPLDEDVQDGVGDVAVAEPGAPDAEPGAPDAEAEAPAAGVPLMATDQPRRWFDFEWKEFPNPPIPPELRRETFSQINVGPTTPRADPYDVFIDIWDRPIMEYIASETNKYALQIADEDDNRRPSSRMRRWRPTDPDELYMFFGILLAMGVVVKSRLEEYWSATSDIFVTPGFNAHMPINRFLLLCKCLHFNDSIGMCALERNSSEARLFKIQPILLHLNKKFQELYTPSQNIALDESLLMWKGCLDFGQLIPNKAAKKGIKSYEVCESQTGYLWRFEIHAHKRTALPPQQFEDPLEAPTPSIVLRLTQGLEHKGYTLWMDNFYNSPCLARRLKSLGFDCVGTLRTDRKFVPQALHSLTKQNMRPGHIAGLTSGDVDVMVWKDSNRVATISTYHGNTVQTTRGSTKPTLILDYNIMMGGVDKKDQLLAMYPVERKRTAVWYKKLFRRLLNVSVLNSYIIHRHSSASSLTHRKFRISLVNSLLSHHRPLPIPIAATQNLRFGVLPPRVGVPMQAAIHRIEEAEINQLLKNARRPRRACIICKKSVITVCVGCNKYVCMKNCFLALHPFINI